MFVPVQTSDIGCCQHCHKIQLNIIYSVSDVIIYIWFTKYRTAYDVRVSIYSVLGMENVRCSNLIQCRLCGSAGYHEIDIWNESASTDNYNESGLSDRIFDCIGVLV